MKKSEKRNTRLIIVRHAEAEGNVDRVFHGWTDSDITEKGHAQAALVAKSLKDMDINVIYSSTLKRTLKTAEYISKVLSLPIIRTDKLKEINGGDWEDMPWSEIPEKWPEEFDSWENDPHLLKMPKGETMKEFQLRIIDEFKYIINNNKGKNICVVTHGTAIRSLMCFFHDCSLEEMVNFQWYDNTSVTVIDHEMEDSNTDKFAIILEGDTSHLSKDLKTIESQDWWIELQSKMKE